MQEPVATYQKPEIFHEKKSARTLQILDKSYKQYLNGNFHSFDEYFAKYKK